MLLDTGAELNALHSRLAEFLVSAERNISIPALVTSSPAPYEKFLPGLRLKRARDRVSLRLAQDGWLELSGSDSYLSKYVSHFRFERPDEDGHQHPDNADYIAPGSLSLIIQADSAWGEENAG
jgi:hypothetical protein